MEEFIRLSLYPRNLIQSQVIKEKFENLITPSGMKPLIKDNKLRFLSHRQVNEVLAISRADLSISLSNLHFDVRLLKPAGAVPYLTRKQLERRFNNRLGYEAERILSDLIKSVT